MTMFILSSTNGRMPRPSLSLCEAELEAQRQAVAAWPMGRGRCPTLQWTTQSMVEDKRLRRLHTAPLSLAGTTLVEFTIAEWEL